MDESGDVSRRRYDVSVSGPIWALSIDSVLYILCGYSRAYFWAVHGVISGFCVILINFPINVQILCEFTLDFEVDFVTLTWKMQ